VSDGARRLAAVDVGSNTIVALVADLQEGHLAAVGRYSRMPELGAEVQRTGRIGPAKTAEALEALESVLRSARRHGYERLVAGATAAVRRAADRDEFLERASAMAGVPVRLIGEQREAELSFLGVASEHAVDHGWLMGDMGGGSTELVAAEGMRGRRWVSLPVGSGGLASRYLSDPPLPAEREALRAAAAAEVARGPECQAEKLVMTGGTAAHLPEMISASEPPAAMTADDLRTAIERLDAGPAAELATRYPMGEGRIRALRAGAEVILLVLARYGLDRFHISYAGLREGMLLASLEHGDDWWL
jgi:exopolyphosphatase/guanosine-5'-triphosphate,3'-diphosphate pyrophosphatase